MASFFRLTYTGLLFSRLRRQDEWFPTDESWLASQGEKGHVTASDSIRPENLAQDTDVQDAHVIVDWDGPDDPENPHNWPTWRKIAVALQIYLYTFAVHMGGAIFASAEMGVSDEFGVNHMASGVGFALYLVGYGVGPLIFSPLSEHSRVGRNPPYILSKLVFVALCIPTALTDSFAGLLVLRFLLGFSGSPCLATGGASLADVFRECDMPFALMFWAFAMTLGPAVAPIIGGFSAPVMGCRWTSWELLWASGPIFKAQRLRTHTKSGQFLSQAEVDEQRESFEGIAFETLVRPWNLMMLDPVIMYVDVYSSLCYAIFYSFFESFRLVYTRMYGFSPGEQGTAFISVTVGTAVAAVWYITYNFCFVRPRVLRGETPAPETKLYLALFSTPMMPVGLFIFAWTSDPGIHWVVSCIGVAITTCGLITMYQCVFLYLPTAYPRYAASLLAGNDFVRSALAGGAVLFSRPLFNNLGVGPGVSLLGGLTAILVPGIYVLYFYGDSLEQEASLPKVRKL
ncbi:major facilitator superfamily domain-containing protein [Paramyrothecium foliicola]|nr:major facilitator superfamily domain-containing protein [Paramyrothecium foliicola]